MKEEFTNTKSSINNTITKPQNLHCLSQFRSDKKRSTLWIHTHIKIPNFQQSSHSIQWFKEENPILQLNFSNETLITNFSHATKERWKGKEKEWTCESFNRNVATSTESDSKVGSGDGEGFAENRGFQWGRGLWWGFATTLRWWVGFA